MKIIAIWLSVRDLSNVGDLLHKRSPFFCNTKALAYPSEIAYPFWRYDILSVSINLENDRINDHHYLFKDEVGSFLIDLAGDYYGNEWKLSPLN